MASDTRRLWQFAPYEHFGCTLREPYNGTLFRFPLRTGATARKSRIKRRSSSVEQMKQLLLKFKDSAADVLLFLRSVCHISVLVCDERGVHPLFDVGLKDTQRRRGVWSQLSGFVQGRRGALSTSGLSKDAFYHKLANSDPSKLPQGFEQLVIQQNEFELKEDDEVKADDEKHVVPATPQAVKVSTVEDVFLLFQQLGAGKARKHAVEASKRQFKFLPWGGVAAHVSRNGKPAQLKGRAFCFLPLPVETGLPVHVNGYFELSANRRDIW